MLSCMLQCCLPRSKHWSILACLVGSCHWAARGCAPQNRHRRRDTEGNFFSALQLGWYCTVDIWVMILFCQPVINEIWSCLLPSFWRHLLSCIPVLWGRWAVVVRSHRGHQICPRAPGVLGVLVRKIAERLRKCLKMTDLGIMHLNHATNSKQIQNKHPSMHPQLIFKQIKENVLFTTN